MAVKKTKNFYFKSAHLKGAVGASASASIVTSEDDSMELSLWGQICLRLAARPECIEDIRMSGPLDIQVVQLICFINIHYTCI